MFVVISFQACPAKLHVFEIFEATYSDYFSQK